MSSGSSTAPHPELGDDFPIICERCLGSNPYTRMMKQDSARECQISGAPFAAFRWQGDLRRWRETMICAAVAREKNCCQSCLNDLEYEVPYHVRDRVMDAIQADDAPTSAVNTEYYWANKRQRMGEGDGLQAERGTYEKLRDNVDRLREFATLNPGPVVWENRREAPLTPEELEALRRRRQLERRPPEDQRITSLFVGGVPPAATRADLLPHFLSYGSVHELSIDTGRLSAIVTFDERLAAEAACAALHGSGLTVRGSRLRVSWARRKVTAGGANSGSSSSMASNPRGMPVDHTFYGSRTAGGPPPPLPPPPPSAPSYSESSRHATSIPPGIRKRPPPPGIHKPYPSMNPDASGTCPSAE